MDVNRSIIFGTTLKLPCILISPLIMMERGRPVMRASLNNQEYSLNKILRNVSQFWLLPNWKKRKFAILSKNLYSIANMEIIDVFGQYLLILIFCTHKYFYHKSRDTALFCFVIWVHYCPILAVFCMSGVGVPNWSFSDPVTPSDHPFPFPVARNRMWGRVKNFIRGHLDHCGK